MTSNLHKICLVISTIDLYLIIETAVNSSRRIITNIAINIAPKQFKTVLCVPEILQHQHDWIQQKQMLIAVVFH